MEQVKQTAVEWVLQYLDNVKPNEFCSIEKIKEVLEQAKAMEKKQIVNAVDGFPLNNRNLEGEEYYEQTYGGENE
jgi:hypothetical protein